MQDAGCRMQEDVSGFLAGGRAKRCRENVIKDKR
jgi:hypothetical protein